MHSKHCDEESLSPLEVQGRIETQPLVKEEKETVIVKKEKEDSNDYLLTPSEERPHHCQLCNKAFTSRQNLRTHLFSHTGERPYVCDTCGKGFTMKRYLTVHERYHSGERRHPCGSCGKRFFSTGDLQKHIRRKHAKNCNEESLSPSELPKQIETQPLVKEEKETVDIVKKEKKGGGSWCAVSGCFNRRGTNKNVSYFTFPKDEEMRNHWITKCYRTDTINYTSANCTICSAHFQDEDFETHIKAKILNTKIRMVLKHGSIPSRNLPKNDLPSTSSGIRRRERMLDKEKKKKQKDIISSILVQSSSNEKSLSVEKLQDELEQKDQEIKLLKEEKIEEIKLLKGDFNLEAQEKFKDDNYNNIDGHLCKFCDKVFTQKHNLKAHLFYHTGERPFVCNTCQKGFTRKCSLQAHETIHCGEKPYPCGTCGKGFTRAYDLRRHEKSHTIPVETHSGKETVDSVKKEEEDNVGHLAEHLLTYFQERPHQCQLCEKAFTSKQNLRMHLLSHTGELPYVCDTCGKRFARRHYLTVHERSHSGEKPFPCGTCEERFRTSCSRYRHQQSVHKITIREIHSVKKEKEAVDSVIKEEEEEDSSDHLLTPSKERPHQCKLCNKAFTSRPILRTHIRSHTGERPYVCETCGKGFITKRYLTVHERYHSGEKHHPCGSCGKRFFSTGDLQKHEKRHIRKFSKIHMRNNSGEHTHGKPFSNSSNLNQHKSILIAGDPLSCPLCSYKATSSHDLLFHIQRMHAKDGNDESPSFSELQGQVLKSEAPS